MIYIFGIEEKIRIVHEESLLTEEEKANATIVLESIEELPTVEYVEGHYAMPFIDPQEKNFHWIYIKEQNDVVETE